MNIKIKKTGNTQFVMHKDSFQRMQQGDDISTMQQLGFNRSDMRKLIERLLSSKKLQIDIEKFYKINLFTSAGWVAIKGIHKGNEIEHINFMNSNYAGHDDDMVYAIDVIG